MKKVFLIGNSVLIYRTKKLINLLYNNGYEVFFSGCFKVSKNLKNKYIKKIINILENLYINLFSTYFLLISDFVILTAANNNNKYLFSLAKLLKKKIITDYYISNYDTLVIDHKKINKESIKARRLYKNERKKLLKSTKIVFLNESEANYYTNIVNVNKYDLDYKIIPIGKETREKAKLRFYNQNKEIFTICWWGSYIPLHGLEKIIQAAKILQEKNFKFKLYILGNSDKKSKKYKELIEKNNLIEQIVLRNDITFYNGKLTELLVNNCDLALGNFGDSKKAKTVIVNKIIDAIAMKIPVLNGESKGPEEFFDFENDIWRTKNTPEAIANEIIKISQTSKENIKKRVNNSFRIYENNFSINSFNKKYLQVLTEIRIKK